MISFLFVVEAFLILSTYFLLKNTRRTYRLMKYYFSYGFWVMVIIPAVIVIQTTSQCGLSREIQMISGGITFFVATLILINGMKDAARKGKNVVYRKFIKDFLSSLWDADEKKSTTHSAPCSVIRLE